MNLADISLNLLLPILVESTSSTFGYKRSAIKYVSASLETSSSPSSKKKSGSSRSISFSRIGIGMCSYGSNPFSIKTMTGKFLSYRLRNCLRWISNYNDTSFRCIYSLILLRKGITMNMDPGTERSLRDMPAQIARLNRSVNELTDCVKSMRDALLLIAVAQDVRCDIDLIRIRPYILN